ncbi:MAG TPA: glutamine-hydrolyzing carbamoyl-phosphate synthase small subunit [Atribacteraceae bacterium]|nr:glutamine-hydrolyzing carbamoyl-phosphate synthase small subunit [Atribacteraceae bacterium]
MKALLALEDGCVFSGTAFGAPGEKSGEVVFNTSMTGYQEILTDPSYCGQIVTMTYPLIGNYGINQDDVESASLHAAGFIVRENSPLIGNRRFCSTLDSYLSDHGIFGLERVDTRALTRHIREQGAMRGVLSSIDLNPSSLVSKARSIPKMTGLDLVWQVTTRKPYIWSSEGKRSIAVLDCGVKFNILRHLARRECRVLVYPADTKPSEILDSRPDGILLSNGPGDPSALPYVIDFTRAVLGKLPIFGVCLGHQIMAQALGAKTYKLKFGHHGGNHPVKELKSGTISITAQNHGFAVDTATISSCDIEATHINLNDNTLEGFRHRVLPLFSVQFHPEAGPGPNDTTAVFDQFISMAEDYRAQKN